jgi:hypothetical protein
MITRMYKVTDGGGLFKYFPDREQAHAAYYNKGTYVPCYIDSTLPKYRELECKYSGNKHDKRKTLVEPSGTRTCGMDGASDWKVPVGGEFLDVSAIKDLKDGFYNAYLFQENYNKLEDSIYYTICLDNIGQVPRIVHDGHNCTTYGCILHIQDTSYVFYRKLNEVIPEPKLELKRKVETSENGMSFFATPKTKAEVEMKLTLDEEKYIDNVLINAKKQAIEEIIAARSKNKLVR